MSNFLVLLLRLCRVFLALLLFFPLMLFVLGFPEREAPASRCPGFSDVFGSPWVLFVFLALSLTGRTRVIHATVRGSAPHARVAESACGAVRARS